MEIRPMKLFFKVVAALLLMVVLAGVGIYVWASTISSRILARTFEVHAVDFPVPFPLSEEERAELGLTAEEAEPLDMERGWSAASTWSSRVMLASNATGPTSAAA